MATAEPEHRLKLQIEFQEEIYLNAEVRCGAWWGEGDGLSYPFALQQFASSVQQVAEGTRATAELSCTYGDRGAIEMFFYRFDRAGHLACQLRLMKEQSGPPAGVFRLEVVSPVEAWTVIQFARALAMYATQSGEVTLPLSSNS